MTDHLSELEQAEGRIALLQREITRLTAGEDYWAHEAYAVKSWVLDHFPDMNYDGQTTLEVVQQGFSAAVARLVELQREVETGRAALENAEAHWRNDRAAQEFRHDLCVRSVHTPHCQKIRDELGEVDARRLLGQAKEALRAAKPAVTAWAWGSSPDSLAAKVGVQVAEALAALEAADPGPGRDPKSELET